MVGDAETHAEDDRVARELAEARNNGENAAYQSERQLKEMEEQVDEAAKGEIEGLIKELRELLESDDAAAINAKAEELQAAFHKVSEAMYEAAAAESAASGDGAASAEAGEPEEEVVDAEVVEEEK